MWYEQMFPAGTSFSGPANLIDWSWTYNAPATCEQWTDALSNGGGQDSGAGNIAGLPPAPDSGHAETPVPTPLRVEDRRFP